ncbi:MAG: ABC transporter permease [Chloroflexi bacterium]|nr:ABC transporter permease [Chloroflexota bacterium]MCH7655735.1 ABC transporter permease [Chloroflexota bacterium]
MRAIFWKEMADHFGRRRFVLLFGLVVMGTLWGVLVDTEQLVRQGDGFFFLDLFTSRIGIPISLLTFISLFGPVIGIALGFDSINSERTQGTLARVLAQPVYRDAVFNGKFLAGLLTLTIVVWSMGISVVGLGMFRLGMAPAGEEVIRLIGFGLVTIAYLAFWLAMAMTASVLLRNTVTSALISIGLWIGLSFFVTIAASVLADQLVPEVTTSEQALRHFNILTWASRLSPGALFTEAVSILLDPIGGRVLTLISVAPERLQGLLATPVSAGQSLQLVWPHIVALVAMVGGLLAVSYTKFMREEIRA